MSMNLTELIKEIGDDNINLQLIPECVIQVKDKKRTQDTEVTLVTTQVSANDIHTRTGKIGIVMWIDRDHVSRAESEINSRSE